MNITWNSYYFLRKPDENEFPFGLVKPLILDGEWGPEEIFCNFSKNSEVFNDILLNSGNYFEKIQDKFPKNVKEI